MNDYGWEYNDLTTGYESPIFIYARQMHDKIIEERENAIVGQISEQIGIDINREELLKALKYDRDQYNKGYHDARITYDRGHGEWICTMHSNFPQYEPDEYRCSICNGIGYKLDKFCKHCGANMQKEADNG